MVLKVVKPKPKYFKISYATLSHHVKTESPKVIQTSSPQSTTKTEKKTTFASKYEKIVDEAIRKNLVDEDEREMKIIELESLSDEEFNAYVQSVKEEEYLDIQNLADDGEEDENLTEAERALAMLRRGGNLDGGIIGDFSSINDSYSDDVMDGFSASTQGGSRSLASIKSENSEYNVEDYNAFNEDVFVADLLKGMKKTGALNQQEEVVVQQEEPKKSNAMSNLKGLTKPIVTEAKPMMSSNSLQDALNSIDWSMGAR